jgi:flagellar assembly factor FliW
MTTTTGTTSGTITIQSQALGRVEVAPESVLSACEPVAGFPDCASYALLEHMRSNGEPSASVFWLQALERPFQAFVVTDPWGVHAEYSPEISDADATQLELASFEDARVFAILTVPANPSEITVNLRAPIVVNVARRLVKQVVLLNDEYHTRHLVNAPAR